MNEMNLVERAALRLLAAGSSPVQAEAPGTAAFVARRASAQAAAGLQGNRLRSAPVGTTRRSRSASFDPARRREFGLDAWIAGRSRLTEEFRVIKRQLLQQVALDDAPGGELNNVIMIASARPGEGRTFTALNLAMSIAMEPARHVLLVDACANANSAQAALGQLDVPGWLDLIASPPADAAEVIVSTDIPRLSVLPRGCTRTGGAELLTNARMRSLIEELANRYSDRIILIDAPPCQASSDPSALAGSVGHIVFLIEAAGTQQDSVEAALEQLRDCENISLLLNKAYVSTSEASSAAYKG